MVPDPVDQIVQAVLAHEQMRQTQAYLARGRPFARLTVEALNEAWLQAVTAVAFGDDGRLGEWADLGAELELRRLPLPEHLMPADVLAALRERIAQSTPEHFEAVTSNVRRIRQELAEERSH